MKKYLKFFLILIGVFSLVNYKIIKVTGNSMFPTLKNGSFAIADLYLHKFFTIQKGDLLLFKMDNKEVVKKIVGFPNEEIEIESKKIKLNNNEIYIIGENLKESIDSREYGPVNKNQILGKVVISF